MRLLILFAVGAWSLAAQSGQALVAPYAELTRFLSLTPNQVQSLMEIQRAKTSAERALYEEVAEKEREVWTLLNQNSSDASRIGSLMIQINQLRKKLPLNGEPYRGQALNLLTPEQKAKLPALTNALLTAPAGYEAIYVNLIENPRDFHIMPAARTVSSVLPDPATAPETGASQ